MLGATLAGAMVVGRGNGCWWGRDWEEHARYAHSSERSPIGFIGMGDKCPFFSNLKIKNQIILSKVMTKNCESEKDSRI